MYDNFFGYSKKSFKQIFSKPILFTPIIIQIAITIFLALWILSVKNIAIHNFSYIMGRTTVVIILFVLINLFLETGKMYMIKQSLTKGNTSINDIIIGAKKFFLRILLGFLAIFALTIALCLVLILPMIILISTGLKIISVIIAFIVVLVFFIFISMWEVIIIYEDCTIFEALSKSVNFAKKHFGIILLIEILKSIFTGNNRGLNFKSSNKFLFKNTKLISLPYFFNSTNIKPAMLILGILISIIFQLFFDVLMFELYIDRRDSIEQI
ncbi:hypothetical protein [Caloranaerobacter ferrireducens]|uniref:hypothetical protein n=1 Tax=Caloranaerobacter ferrireducens TaxID=1323370 RepID=UPI00084CF501|nr:hypothetical protein [Caloranaerobacter ferrireducens]